MYYQRRHESCGQPSNHWTGIADIYNPFPRYGNPPQHFPDPFPNNRSSHRQASQQNMNNNNSNHNYHGGYRSRQSRRNTREIMSSLETATGRLLMASQVADNYFPSNSYSE
jgi:hypothetical protein